MDSTTLFGLGKIFEGLATSMKKSDSEPTPPSESDTGGLPEGTNFTEAIDKAIVDRETDSGFISVSGGGKNVTLLGYALPEDAVAESHDLIDRYGVLLYRQGAKSRDEFVILDAETTTGEAQNYAIELVENNRTSTYYARVFIGVPWTFNGRSVFRGFVSFYLLSKSAVGLADSSKYAHTLRTTKAALAESTKFLVDETIAKSEAARKVSEDWIKKLDRIPLSKSAFEPENPDNLRYIHFLDKAGMQAVISLSAGVMEGSGNGAGARNEKFTNKAWVDPTEQLSVSDLTKCVPAAIADFAQRYVSAIKGDGVEKSMLIYPYKSVEGQVNLNAVRKVQDALKRENGHGTAWENELPQSIRLAVKVELAEIMSQAPKITRNVEFIKKADALKRGLVYGLVYEPLVKDTHEDFATAEEIESAAHAYLPAAMLNVEHKNEETLKSTDSVVVESYIAPCDFQIDDDVVKKGSWILVTKIFSKELLEDVRSGKITGYSMEGTAFKL